jgi:hypothetical protein
VLSDKENLIMFMAFALGVLAGAVLGAIGMFHLIKETNMDLVDEYNSIDLDDPWESEELEMPQEVKYGDF